MKRSCETGRAGRFSGTVPAEGAPSGRSAGGAPSLGPSRHCPIRGGRRGHLPPIVGVVARRGSAIFIATIMGVVFFMVVSSLLHYLSGEKRQVKHVIGKKQAELLAISGIDWADQELRQGRWYQPPFGTTKTGGGRVTAGVKELTPFGAGLGKVTVVCEDIPAEVPVSNVRNMQQLWLLHHINVFAMGEFGEFRCLLYGRFIISPEPALNDSSTEAVIYSDSEGANPGQVAVRIPEVAGIDRFKVTQIHCQTGSQVDINKVVITLETTSGGKVQTVEVRPPSHGVVRTVRCRVGDLVSSRDVLVILAKAGAGGQGRTLKRMVRITRIDEDPWIGMDIRDFQDRNTLTRYLGVLSSVYLMNFGSRPDLAKAAETYRDGGLPKTMTPEEFLQKFPAKVRNTTEDRAENEFLAGILRRFTLTPAKDWPVALRKIMLQLDHPRMDVPAELRTKLQELNLLNLRDTTPRRDPRYFTPKIPLDEYLTLLKPEFNRDSDSFIKSVSELPDASRWIEVLNDPKFKNLPASLEETAKGIKVTRPESEAQVSVAKIAKPYDFVDPTADFQTRLEHVLEFIRKYYSDKNAVIPKEERRNLEFLDWPLPDPAPAPPPSKGVGEWVWVPGEPGVPPGRPTWKYEGGRELKIPFPSGGRRDFEPAGGPPGAGERTYGVDGIAPTSGGAADNKGARPEDGSGKMRDKPAGAPVEGGTGDTQGGGPPETGGDEGGSPGRAPEPDNSIFSTQHPTVKIPSGGKFTGTAGPAGIPPKQGEYSWVEPCPPGGSPGGAGGEGSWAQGGNAPGAGQSDGNRFGGDNPGGGGQSDGRGKDLDGRPAGVDGNGLGLDGKPGQSDGSGFQQDGGPGQSDGYGTGLDGKPGQADGSGFNQDGRPGQAGGQQGVRPGDTSGSAGKPGSTGNQGNPTGAGSGKPSSPVYTCPTCGKLHKNPNYGGGKGSPGGGSGGSSTRGGV